MNVAIVGAGFTGLSAAKILLESGHKVTVFEKEKEVGGLASSFKLPHWQWAIERHYHHWFTNDTYAIGLINDLGLGKHLLIPKSVTSIYVDGKIYPFNSPADVLRFSPLTITERLKTGLLVAYLKALPASLAMSLERQTAYHWLNEKFGDHIFSLLW